MPGSAAASIAGLRDFLEDVEWIVIQGGETMEGVQRRMNVSETTLRDRLNRAGRSDLLRRISINTYGWAA